jgi:RNA polymerase sigma-70 factor (family 1)
MGDSEKYDDQILLSLISQGDENAFKSLFERYRNQIFTHLYKITKSSESAEEMVLDVFLKLWLGREAIIEIKDIEAFLFRVARNKGIDFIRAARRDPLRRTELWDLMQEAASNESADKNLLLKNTRNAIDMAVQQLSPQRQIVYLLSRKQGLSNGEISKKLGLSRLTVRNHLAASLSFIRKYIKSDDILLLFGLFWSSEHFFSRLVRQVFLYVN